MKLATMPGGGPDGTLFAVSRDLRRAVDASAVAPTLQHALDDWDKCAGQLHKLSADLEQGGVEAMPFDPSVALAPLPRAWQWLDASAFESHGRLMAQVFGIQDPPREKPLMYQGMSHRFLSAHDDVPFLSEADGIDFEGEFAVITGKVAMGASPAEAERQIKLVAQVNDWSLRTIAPVEMKTGFGWIQAKPACSMAPVVVTPDELGNAWQNGRVALDLQVELDGRWFGQPNGAAMGFSFPELVSHAAGTRDLCAGTIIGSGTVSNDDFRELGSTCIAERRGIEVVDQGKPQTPFMKFGQRVRMEARGLDGGPVFGAIDQTVRQRGVNGEPVLDG